jgi:U3 small nucleolar RNA-associated protein 12
LKYGIELEAKDASKVAKIESTYGELECHKMDIRGIVISATDNMFATNSFDSVKVWSVELNANLEDGGLDIDCKQTLEETNVLSMAMLPGNKYLVLGTKEGQMCLYELGSNSII